MWVAKWPNRCSNLVALQLRYTLSHYVFQDICPDLPFLGVLFFLGLFEPRKFLGALSVSSCFSLFSRGFLGFRGGKNSLVFGVVFRGFDLNTKERKIRVVAGESRYPHERAP